MSRRNKRWSIAETIVCLRQSVVTLAIIAAFLPLSFVTAQRLTDSAQALADPELMRTLGHQLIGQDSQADPAGRWPAQMLQFQVIAIEPTRDGGSRLVGEAKNYTPRQIHRASIVVEYRWKGKVVLRERFPWGPMRPYEERRVGLLLRPVLFEDVRMMAIDVELGPSIN